MTNETGTSYLPPEYFVEIDRKKGLFALRTLHSLSEHHLDVTEALIAQTAVDIWGLGCILYQLSDSSCKPLFRSCNAQNNITEYLYKDDNVWKLIDWSDAIKIDKLSSIQNIYAR